MIKIFNVEYFQIPDCDGYFIAKNGQIFSNKSKKIMKQRTTYKGYKTVDFIINGKKRKFFVHRLVLKTFVGESSKQTRHINDKRDDNRLENLEYCTAQENTNDKFFHNRKFQKLTAEQAIQIAKDRRPYKQIAKEFNISFNGVTDIKSGLVWGKVTQNNRYRRYTDRTYMDYLLEKFTREDIDFICDKNNPRKDIAQKFNISISVIKRIRRYMRLGFYRKRGKLRSV